MDEGVKKRRTLSHTATTQPPVLADAAYGNGFGFRQWLRQLGLECFLGVTALVASGFFGSPHSLRALQTWALAKPGGSRTTKEKDRRIEMSLEQTNGVVTTIQDVLTRHSSAFSDLDSTMADFTAESKRPFSPRSPKGFSNFVELTGDGAISLESIGIPCVDL